MADEAKKKGAEGVVGDRGLRASCCISSAFYHAPARAVAASPASWAAANALYRRRPGCRKAGCPAAAVAACCNGSTTSSGLVASSLQAPASPSNFVPASARADAAMCSPARRSPVSYHHLCHTRLRLRVKHAPTSSTQASRACTPAYTGRPHVPRCTSDICSVYASGHQCNGVARLCTMHSTLPTPHIYTVSTPAAAQTVLLSNGTY